MATPERYGSYLVYEQIGKGGMATVHRAELPTKRGVREVALKRLFPTLQRELVALFLDEAKLLRYLDHPNIARTYDSGRVFGTYFIAMEYVRGPTLKQLVAHCRDTVGPVPQTITLNLAAQLCEALDHAHHRRDEHGRPLGIVHRDVSPANIIISETGLLKLIDFGLARAAVMTEHTAAGVIKGKYAYVAPEDLGGNLDHRADLWAVGIVMYELLTGRALFDGFDAFETTRRVRELPIPRPSRASPEVTPELDAVVMRALERDLTRRWQSAAEMREAIEAVIARPGNAIANPDVAAWIQWALDQSPGKPIHPYPSTAPARLPTFDVFDVTTGTVTEVTPSPDATEPGNDAVPDTLPDAGPPAPPTPLPLAPGFRWTPQSIMWAALAGVLLLVVLGSLVWKVVG